MRYEIWVAGAMCLGLSACASPNAGNPDGNAYAGSTQSVYDAAANPPRTNGTVRYEPNAPLPSAMAPAGDAAMSAPMAAGNSPR